MAQMTMHELEGNLTQEELRDLAQADARPPVEDEDCPFMTKAQLAQFKRVRQASRAKQPVSLRLSSATLQKAKQYGKGYTAFLSRLLDAAIEDEDLWRKCI